MVIQMLWACLVDFRLLFFFFFFFFSGRGLSICSSATTSSTRIWIELSLKKDSVAYPAMNVEDF